MKVFFKHTDFDKEFYTKEGCYILELINSATDPDVSIAQARVPPGGTTRWHRLREIQERYIILEGKGLVEIGDASSQEVTAGDIVFIPAGYLQRIQNIGQQDLIFLAICTPRFTNEQYEEIEHGEPEGRSLMKKEA